MATKLNEDLYKQRYNRTEIRFEAMLSRKAHVSLIAVKKDHALEEPGATFSSAAKQFKIDRRTVARIQKYKPEILQQATTQEKRKRRRYGCQHEVS